MLKTFFKRKAKFKMNVHIPFFKERKTVEPYKHKINTYLLKALSDSSKD